LRHYGILDVTEEKVTYKSLIATYDDTIPRKRMEEIYALLGIELR
jgi:hypothetical protein